MAIYTHLFPSPLLEGTLLGRYNRFLADIRLLSGEVVTAHCVNTGRMEGLTKPGLRVWLSRATNPKAKLDYVWEIAEADGILVGTNTSAPNRVVRALLEGDLLKGFTGTSIRPEYRINAHSRVDFLIEDGERHHYVEVKNCHLVYPDGRGYFPDSVSERGAKHLRELAELCREGHKASVLFFGQREDTKAIRPSDVHDPAFAIAARAAAEAGVKFHALCVRPTLEGLVVEKFIPVDLKPYDPTKPRKWMEEKRAEAPAWTRNRPSA